MSFPAILRSCLLRKCLQNGVKRRLISTSKNKKSDTVAISDVAKSETIHQTDKNWVSYGFDYKDKKADRTALHAAMFGCVTVVLVWGGFYIAYLPDYNLHDWSTREAFLELHRRETQGLPLIDPNLINPSKIHLPSDEELGDTEIII